VALIGASHGGWAVLDLLSLAGEGRVPHGLTAWPPSIAAAPLAGVVAAVTLYPYCGVASLAGRRGWTGGPPVLMLLAEDDAITGETACLALAARQQAAGGRVETHVYPRVTHGFDQQDRSFLSPLEFDPAATADALSRMMAFLGAAAAR
jgi:dienelactone hydrolase